MKINQNDINRFLSNVPSGIKSVLFFGTDKGMVYERAKILQQFFQKKHQNLNLNRHYYDDIKKGEVNLMEKISNRSFFSQFEFFLISNLPNKTPPEVESAIAKLGTDQFLVLLAEELPASSSLRKFYEDSKDLAIIGCYPDDNQGIRTIITNKMKENNIALPSDLLEYLSNNLAGDRKHILNELDKLVLYVGAGGEITYDDIKDSCSFADNLSYEDLNFALAEGKIMQALEIYHILLGQGINQVSIIRSIINYFIRLYQVKCLVADDVDIKLAMKKLVPPVFIMHTNIFIKHMQRFSLGEMRAILTNLYNLEILSKTTGSYPEIQIENFILSFKK